jgi:primosomal protein N' (replication factor Y)
LPIGQGTEQIEERLKQLIPEIRIARVDRDTIVSRKVYGEIFKGFAHGEFDVLVGTQMITKGLDFPRLTLVGVLDADQSLHFPDFRAAERTFQLLTQVAGRSGRGETLGRVLIQTFSPDHYAIQAASRQDYSLFYEQELQMRQGLEYPPFSRFACLHFSGMREPQVASAAGECAQELQRWMAREKVEDQVELLGPAPALITRVAGRYRYQLVLKAKDRKPLEVVLNRLSQHLGDRPRQWGSCRFDIDIDPQSIL